MLGLAIFSMPSVLALDSIYVEDSSGNGFNLTEAGSPIRRYSPESKYGEGIDFDQSDNRLSSTANGLKPNGDFVFSFAFMLDVESARQIYICIDNALNAFLFMFEQQADNTIRILMEIDSGASQHIATSTDLVYKGFWAGYVRFDDGNNTLELFMNGQRWISTTPTVTPNGLSILSDFRVGVHCDGTTAPMNGGFFELRYWKQLVANSTLENLSDPNNYTYAGIAEGNETALWLFGDMEGTQLLPTGHCTTACAGTGAGGSTTVNNTIMSLFGVFTGFDDGQTAIMLLWLFVLFFAYHQRLLFLGIAGIMGSIDHLLDVFGGGGVLGFVATLMILLLAIIIEALVEIVWDAKAKAKEHAEEGA